MTELVAALAGALVGAVAGGVVTDLWATRRARLRAAAAAIASLRRTRFELVRARTTLEITDHAMLGSASSWLLLQLPPSALEASRHIVEDLPLRLIETIDTCDAAAREAADSVQRGIAPVTVAGQLQPLQPGPSPLGSSEFFVRTVSADLEHAIEILRSGIEELERYHRDLSELMAWGD